MQLRAVTVWVSLPLLQRLEAFLFTLAVHQQRMAAAEAVLANTRSDKWQVLYTRLGISQSVL